MSLKVKDSKTGKLKLRKKPSVSVTLSPNMLEDIDDWAKEVGMSRSEVMERCIGLGMQTFFKGTVEPARKRNGKIVVEKRSDEDLRRDRYWGRKVTDYNDTKGWNPV